MADKKKKMTLGELAFWIGGALLIVLELLPPTYSADKTLNGIIDVCVTRGLGSLLFIILAACMKFNIFGFRKEAPLRALLFCIPSLLVVINNFPFIGLISGGASLSRTELLPIYALPCLLIGLFEEFAFRGVLFLTLLEDRRESSRSIFWASVISSALFGLIHLANLAVGGGLGATLLQVSYSFLIGGMCSIVLLKTHCIWIPVLLHGIFDFGGFIVTTLGSGRIWDPVTVITTALLGVAVTVFMLLSLLRITPAELEPIFKRRKNSKTA